jgi:hypothetical protein
VLDFNTAPVFPQATGVFLTDSCPPHFSLTIRKKHEPIAIEKKEPGASLFAFNGSDSTKRKKRAKIGSLGELAHLSFH